MISQRAIKSPLLETAILELSIRTTGAEIIPAKLLMKLLISTNNPPPSFDSGLRWESLPSFAGDFLERDARSFLRLCSY